MAIEKCNRCDTYYDLDTNVDDIGYVGDIPVCVNCMTEAEFDDFVGEY